MSSLIFWGPPGGGKTTLASTFTKLGYRVHYIDLDKKVNTMMNLQPLIKAKKVTFQEIESPIQEESLSAVARGQLKFYPKKMPSGYMEVCNIIDAYDDKPPTWAKRTVLVLDSSTRLNEHLVALMKHYQKGKLEFSGWGAVLANYEALFSTFFALQPDTFAHCVMCCHARDDKDEDLGRIWSKPLIDTQMREKAGTYVEEMYYCIASAPTKTGVAKFQAITKPTGRILHARSSRSVPTTVDGDMSKIFKKGGKK